MIFYEKSPRNINIEQAIRLTNYIKSKKIISVGVFVNKPINLLINLIDKINLNHIQLHGSEDDNYIYSLKKRFEIKIIKSIGIRNEEDLKKINNFTNADYLLFDYKSQNNELPGGNAKKFDWSLIQNIKIDKPWFISGGININNIGEINKNLIPYGIDISSGVEDHPGIKNCKKITEIMKIINA